MSRPSHAPARWRARSGWLLAASALVSAACEWDPRKPLQRYAPAVDQALADLDAGQAERAADALTEYLDSHRCERGAIAISRALSEKQHAGVDLSWVLFRLAESYGKRLVEAGGAAPPSPGGEGEGDERAESHRQCALQVVRALADAGSNEDRARAAYLEGNLLFLGALYKESVQAYDRALLAWPSAEGDDLSLGADAAFNRALALKWSQEEPPDGGEPDASDPDGGDDQDASQDQDGGDDQDASQDQDGGDDQNDAGKDQDGGDDQDASQDQDSGDDQNDAGKDQDGGDDQSDAGAQPDQDAPDASPDGGAARPESQEADEPPLGDGGVLSRELLDRLLDDLERAPTVQQEAAKQNRRRVRPEDDR